jgi:hypothetical protein
MRLSAGHALHVARRETRGTVNQHSRRAFALVTGLTHALLLCGLDFGAVLSTVVWMRASRSDFRVES